MAQGARLAHEDARVTALVLLLLAGEAAGQSVASVAAIDRTCQIAARSAARSRPQVFADVSDPEDSNSRQDWRRFGSRAGLAQYARDGDASSQALFWRHANTVFVKMTFAPPSGDSVHEVDYCFATNGRLLRVESRLGTTHGFDPATDAVATVSRQRTSHFGPDGRVLRTTTRVLDASTGRPAPRLQYMDDDEPIFKTVDALPFISLVRQAGSPLLLAQRGPMPVVTRTVPSETTRDAGLERIVAEYAEDFPDERLEYRYNRVDLDGDGTPEVILRIEGRAACGTGGCRMYVLRKRGRDYQEITSMTLTWPPIVVSEHRTRGWRDLILWVRYDAFQSRYMVLSFDGTGYPDNPSVEPARPLSERTRGIAYLGERPRGTAYSPRAVSKP